MTPHGNSARWLVVAAVTVMVATGCGVRLQSEAMPVPASVIPSPLRIPVPDVSQPPPTTLDDPAPARLRLWFVQEDGLAAVESPLASGTEPEVIVQALVAGPSAAQVTDGLRTVAADPLTGTPFVSIGQEAAEPVASAIGEPSVDASQPETGLADEVTVQLSSAFTSLPPGEQVLLLGQVVLSLTGAGASSVAFTDEAGTPLAVPLPDGRLLDLAATTRDYASLIVRP